MALKYKLMYRSFCRDNGGKITTSKIVEWVVLGISFLITIWAAWYIYAKMNKWRPIVLEERAANAIGATEVVERDPVVGTIGSFSQPTIAGVPRVTLSGEDGIVKSPSGRVSLNKWPFHGQGHNRGSDGGSGGSTAGKMEEGSLGELDGAKRPLVADSASPAGYLSSQGGHYQNSLYPVSSGPSPYASTEDIGYGYADGGEGYSVPYRRSDTVDPASSENVFMKWNPPQLERDQPTYPQQNRLEQTRQRTPATMEQYSPASYREAYQTPSESAKSAPPARYEQASSRNTSPQMASSWPRSLEQSQPGPVPVPSRHADESLQSSMAGFRPSSRPYSYQASPVGRHLETSYPQESSLPPGASIYPAKRNLMPQPSGGKAPEHSIPEPRQEPLSSYPDMVNSRGGKPINTTQFHTGPAGQASSRYHTEPNPSRPSVYHTGQAAPDAAYRAQGPSQSRRQQQEQYSQYPPAEEYHQPIDAPPRYQ